jgi:hypothetical protein
MHRCASDFPKRTTAFLDFLWIEADRARTLKVESRQNAKTNYGLGGELSYVL